MYDSRTFPLDYPAQRGNCAGIGDRRMEWASGVRVKGRSAAAPSANADDVYTVECFLGRIVTGLECHDRDCMAEAD
jgi:hypothetical protein